MIKINEIFSLLRLSDPGLLCPHKPITMITVYKKYSEGNDKRRGCLVGAHGCVGIKFQPRSGRERTEIGELSALAMRLRVRFRSPGLRWKCYQARREQCVSGNTRTQNTSPTQPVTLRPDWFHGSQRWPGLPQP